jgi:hypothetical protein
MVFSSAEWLPARLWVVALLKVELVQAFGSGV